MHVPEPIKRCSLPAGMCNIRASVDAIGKDGTGTILHESAP